MPEDKITPVPTHPRISIFVETPLFSWPISHIEAIKPPKIRKFQGIEVDVFPIPVGHPEIEQAVDDGDDSINSLGGPREMIGDFHFQQVHLFKEVPDVLISQLPKAHISLLGLLDGLILNVCEIHTPLDREPEEFEVANQDIFEKEGSEVPDMGPLVDRRATREYGGQIVVHRSKLFDPFPQGIEKPQHEFPFPVLLPVQSVRWPLQVSGRDKGGYAFFKVDALV